MRKKKLPGYKRGETQLLIARQWASIRSYVAALEDLGWILKKSVAMAVIAIHGNSTQWCENNLLFDLVPKTSSFCFLSPKTQAFIGLCSVQNWAFHFQQWQGRRQNKGQIQKDVQEGSAVSLSFRAKPMEQGNKQDHIQLPFITDVHLDSPHLPAVHRICHLLSDIKIHEEKKKPNTEVLILLPSRTLLRWGDLTLSY